MLIIVVISADAMPRCASLSRKIKPNCCRTGNVQSWKRFSSRNFEFSSFLSHIRKASSEANKPTKPAIRCYKVGPQLRVIPPHFFCIPRELITVSVTEFLHFDLGGGLREATRKLKTADKKLFPRRTRMVKQLVVSTPAETELNGPIKKLLTLRRLFVTGV